MYNEKKYLNRKDIRAECYEFSFSHPHETLEYHHQLLNTTDIFYMTGTTHGHPTSDALVEVFKKHAFVGPDERDQSDVEMNLFRAIKRRVQYNDMVFMGVCGGAALAGRRYWCQLARNMEDDVDLFDFFMGVSVHYDANSPPASCDTRVISERTFQITSGAALSVHIANDIALARSFPCTRKPHWIKWCEAASELHMAVIQVIARHVSGPWSYPSVGIWWFGLNGRVLRGIEQAKQAA